MNLTLEVINTGGIKSVFAILIDLHKNAIKANFCCRFDDALILTFEILKGRGLLVLSTGTSMIDVNKRDPWMRMWIGDVRVLTNLGQARLG